MITLILTSVLFGILLTLAVQALWLRKRFGDLPKLAIPQRSQFDRFRLPQELIKLLSDTDLKSRKESCLFMNLICQFLFRELKDTTPVRKWVTKKINQEFEELLQTTSGKLLEQISVRDLNFGTTFPIIHSASVKNVVTSEDDQCLEELDVNFDIDYRGGIHLAVEADLLFGKCAYLSVKVMRLKGDVRLQLTRQPYSHWSMAFSDEPLVEFEVESRFEGRPIPQLTSLIVNQIRRSIRKKHTLPNYKMRFRPLFTMPNYFSQAKDLYFHGNLIGLGAMEVTILECSRLIKVPPESLLYCTIGVDSLPWSELVTVRKKYMTHDVDINRSQGQSIGLTFKEDFLLERYEAVVVVDSMAPDSPAAQSNIKKNDILIAVGGHRVTSMKNAAKLLRNAGEKFSIRVERAMLGRTMDMTEIKFSEDITTAVDPETEMKTESAESLSKEEEFINISIKSCNGDVKESKDSEEKVNKKSTVASLLRRRVKPFSPDASPQDSPERHKHRHITSSASASVLMNVGADRSLSKQANSEIDGDLSSESSPARHPKMPAAPRSYPDLLAEAYNSSDDEDDVKDLRKTKFVKGCQEPIWNEKFKFDIEEQHKYLNICLWCKAAEKQEKTEKVVKPRKDFLMGHISLAISDISLECLTTLQGDTQRTIHLLPVESKAWAMRVKLPNLGGHPGFEPHMCYGDITIAARYSPSKMPARDKKKLTKEPQLDIDEDEDIDQRLDAVALERKLEECTHDFVSTQFHSATYCHFCSKKIWLKMAFQCNTCAMICHKKCTEKCQAQTLCTRDGVRCRTEPDSAWKPPINPSEGDKKKDEKEPLQQKSSSSSATGGGLFGKFRKGKSPHGSPIVDRKKKHSDDDSEASSTSSTSQRKRRNSAPDENENGANSGKFLSVSSIPRTRSSTSLQDLLEKNAAPALTSEELRKSESCSQCNSSDDDSDSSESSHTMKRLVQEHKRSGGHNVEEMTVMAAKEMGKELFAHLNMTERKAKLDYMVCKLQQEINHESEHRTGLGNTERIVTDSNELIHIQSKIVKSDEKVQALMVLMLHYCAGLQHCLDLEAEEGQQQRLGQSGVTDQGKQLQDQPSYTFAGHHANNRSKAMEANQSMKVKPEDLYSIEQIEGEIDFIDNESGVSVMVSCSNEKTDNTKVNRYGKAGEMPT